MPVLVAATAALGWSIAVSPYLWAPGVSTAVATPFGTLEAERSPGDVLSSVDFALMGTVEARNGRLGLIADLVFANSARATLRRSARSSRAPTWRPTCGSRALTSRGASMTRPPSPSISPPASAPRRSTWT